MAESAPPRHVSIILVSYRGKDDTLECLESLSHMTYPAYDVFVVDQNSGDGLPLAVQERYPGVYVVENPINNGFAGGNNVGIRAAQERETDYLFLLNNDTVVDPGLLEPLVALAEGNPAIGVVGPKILYHAQPETIWATGGTVDWRGTSTLLDEGAADAPGGDVLDRDFVVGCALLIKRSVLAQVGLLDERYFIYYEESDLCARVRAAGYRVVYQPAARLWHKVSKTFGQSSEFTLYYMRRNVLLYLAMHGRRPLLGRLAALWDTLRLAVVWTAQGKHRRRYVLLRAVGDYFGRRFGQAQFPFQ